MTEGKKKRHAVQRWKRKIRLRLKSERCKLKKKGKDDVKKYVGGLEMKKGREGMKDAI